MYDLVNFQIEQTWEGANLFEVIKITDSDIYFRVCRNSQNFRDPDELYVTNGVYFQKVIKYLNKLGILSGKRVLHCINSDTTTSLDIHDELLHNGMAFVSYLDIMYDLINFQIEQTWQERYLFEVVKVTDFEIYFIICSNAQNLFRPDHIYYGQVIIFLKKLSLLSGKRMFHYLNYSNTGAPEVLGELRHNGERFFTYEYCGKNLPKKQIAKDFALLAKDINTGLAEDINSNPNYRGWIIQLSSLTDREITITGEASCLTSSDRFSSDLTILIKNFLNPLYNCGLLDGRRVHFRFHLDSAMMNEGEILHNHKFIKKRKSISVNWFIQTKFIDDMLRNINIKMNTLRDNNTNAMFKIAAMDATTNFIIDLYRQNTSTFRPKTITDDAEWVTDTLKKLDFLRAPRKVLYRDTEGNIDELVHVDGKFSAFKPASGPAAEVFA